MWDHLKEFGWGNIIAVTSVILSFIIMFTKYRAKLDGVIATLSDFKKTVGGLASIKDLEKVEKALEEVGKKLEHIETHGCVRVTGDLTAVHRELEDHDRRLARVEDALVKVARMAEAIDWIKREISKSHEK